jgi:hypothetical protein
MTEKNIDWRNTPRHEWTPHQEAAYGLHLAEERKMWEQQQAQRKEQERVSELRAEMDRYREERLTDWMEHGGDPAMFSQVWPSMMKDYLDGKVFEREAERAAKLAESIESIYP